MYTSLVVASSGALALLLHVDCASYIIVDLFPLSPPRLFPLLSLFLLLQNEIAELRTKLEDQRAEAALGARELEECRSEKVALRAHLEECIADKRAVEVKMAALYDRMDAEALVAMHNKDAATATASESMRDAMERNIRADLEVSSGAAHALAVDEAVTYVNHVELLPAYASSSPHLLFMMANIAKQHTTHIGRSVHF